MSARLPPINVVLAQSAATPRRRGEPPAPSARKRGRSTALAALLADATDNVLVRELGSADSRRRAPARFVAGPASGKIPKPVVLDAVEVVEVVEVDDEDVEVESEAESVREDAPASPPLPAAPAAPPSPPSPRACAPPPKKRLRAALAATDPPDPPAPPDAPDPPQPPPPPRLPIANASWRRPRQPPAPAPAPALDRCAKNPFAPSWVVPLA